MLANPTWKIGGCAGTTIRKAPLALSRLVDKMARHLFSISFQILSRLGALAAAAGIAGQTVLTCVCLFEHAWEPILLLPPITSHVTAAACANLRLIPSTHIHSISYTSPQTSTTATPHICWFSVLPLWCRSQSSTRYTRAPSQWKSHASW